MSNLKKKFYEALKEKEKNKNDLFQIVNLKDDYLVSLYKNVYLNNPDHDFIFQNPTLILNYIFIDISSNDNLKKEANELIFKQKIEEENNLNKSKIRKSNSLINNKYINNAHSIKEEEPNSKLPNNKAPSTFKNANSNLNWHKESNDNYNKTNPSLKGPNNYFNLKYNIEEDNLKICPKVSEVSYFIRKKTRSATSSWAGRFYPSFGKKIKANERRSILPDLFLKFNEKKETSKKKLSAGTANDNYKEIVIRNKPIVNNKRMSGIIKFPEKNLKKNRKKSIFDSNQSCKHLHDRLSMNFILYHKDSEEKDKQKDNNNINQKQNSKKEIKDKNIFEEKKDEENNNNNKENLKIEQNKENQEIDENISKKSSKINIVQSKSILNINSESENKNEINNKIEKNNNIENINNTLKKEEEEFKILNINQNNQGLIKNSRTKINKKNEFPKHNSMKEFNHANLLLTTNIINRIATKKNKNLMISTKKTLAKPKTYNYFSPEQIQSEEEDIYYNDNKKIVYSLSQKKLKNNYGYKSKGEQENEVIHGAINYLQHEYRNKNKKNKIVKENSLLNNRGINMGTFQNKYKINENNNSSTRNKFNYKISYDCKKKGKQIGEESEMSLNSTSSGFILNNISSYGASSYMDRSSESDIFQKEMRRIINFNKRLKSNGKCNNIQLNNNQFSNNNFKNKMKKSSSQPNFFDKKNLGIPLNAEKSMYNKDNQISKNNKNISLLSSISKRNLNKLNNVTLSTSRNCCLNDNQINSFSNNINNKKYNVKSSQNRKSNITKIKSNKENNKINYVDFYEDEQKYFQKNNENSNDYNYEYKNENIGNENSKFRFVLDKYMKKQKKRSPKHQIDEEKNRNIIKENKNRKNLEENKVMKSNSKIGKEDEELLENNEEKDISIRKDEKNVKNKASNCNMINNDKGENSDFFSSKSNIKGNNNNEKSIDKDNESFFNEGINFENLSDNNINEIKIDNKKINEFGNNYNDNNGNNNNNNKDNIDDNNDHNDNINENNDNNNDYNDYNNNNVYINTNDSKDNINNNNDNINENNDNNNINNYNIEYINNKDNKDNINNNNINNNDSNYYNNKIDEEIKKVTNESQYSSLNNNIKIRNANENKLSLNNKSNNSSKNSNNNLENVKQNINENKYYNSSKDSSSCNELGEDMNIQGKINLPSFAPSIIRRASQQNKYNKQNINEDKNENNSINNYIINSNNSNGINYKNFSNDSKNSLISSKSNNKGNKENNQEHMERNDLNIFGNIINQKYERPNYKKK